MRFEIRVPAKINLWLEVVAKRKDGYHELSSLMLPIRVYDRLELMLQSDGVVDLKCDHPSVPQDSSNLAWKAAELYLRRAGDKKGVVIRLYKRIPVGAGLGGGSADAAATLLGLNALAANPLDDIQLHTLAKQLGADVPFFLYGRPALATGIGEKLRFVEGLPSYQLILIKPPQAVSTRQIYQSLKLTRGISHINVDRFLGQPWALPDVMANDLEGVTAAELPVIHEIKQWLKERGAVGAIMSGSGPTVFGVFRERRVATEVEVQAKQTWKECWVMASESLGTSAFQD